MSRLERKLTLNSENWVAVWLRYGQRTTKIVQLLWFVNNYIRMNMMSNYLFICNTHTHTQQTHTDILY